MLPLDDAVVVALTGTAAAHVRELSCQSGRTPTEVVSVLVATVADDAAWARRLTEGHER